MVTRSMDTVSMAMAMTERSAAKTMAMGTRRKVTAMDTMVTSAAKIMVMGTRRRVTAMDMRKRGTAMGIKKNAVKSTVISTKKLMKAMIIVSNTSPHLLNSGSNERPA